MARISTNTIPIQDPVNRAQIPVRSDTVRSGTDTLALEPTSNTAANPSRFQDERSGLNSGAQRQFQINRNETLFAGRNVTPTSADRRVGNAGDVVGYGSRTIKVNQGGKEVPISVNEIVRQGIGPSQIMTGPRHAKINGTNVYLDYHGTQPVRMTFSPAAGAKPISGVIVRNGANYEFVQDKPLAKLGVDTQITNPEAKPWRELGIPDWRQRQLQGIANDYMTRTLPMRPGGASEPRRTTVDPKTDFNIAAGNSGQRLPVLDYKDIGSIFASIAKDQRLTDSEKFEVSRLISQGYGRRQDGPGSAINTLVARRYLLSSRFSRPENADSGIHTAFPWGGRPFHQDDHGTHIVNGANYSDNRHAGWLQGDIRRGLDDATVITNFRNRATREETFPISNRVNVGDVESSVNASRALLAGFRQSQASGGRSGYAAFAIEWIRGAVSDREASQLINDFRLRDELRR